MLALEREGRGATWRVDADSLADAGLDFDWTAAAVQLDSLLST